MRPRTFVSLGVLLLTLMIAGCGNNPKSSYGFTLPEGDVDRGKTAFVELKCTDCHSVSGVDFNIEPPGERLSVTLGGKVSRIQTYGELVTSIINPSHELPASYTAAEVSADGQSKMRVYNDVLTVSQLIDLVAFLQSRYELEPIEPTHYPPYGVK